MAKLRVELLKGESGGPETTVFHLANGKTYATQGVRHPTLILSILKEAGKLTTFELTVLSNIIDDMQ